jgi:hypothetical protein
LVIDKECWQYLVSASGDARYLDQVPAEAIEDAKNPNADTRLRTTRYVPRIDVARHDWQELELPDFPDPPSLELRFVKEGQAFVDFGQQHLYSPGLQRYHQEIWTEKSTMDDTVRGPCIDFGVTQQNAQGEFSLSKALELCERVRQVNKPCIVWYCSDCDPGGKSMPVAFSRKLEWCIRHIPTYQHLDIRVIPLVLSRKQVEHYELPLSEIKESEKRGSAFEERDGKGSCELDAMEALFPGELPRLSKQAFGHFFDAELEPSCDEVEEQIRDVIDEKAQEVAKKYASRYRALNDKYDAVVEEFKERVQGINEERQELWDEWVDELEEIKPNVDDEQYARPEPDDADLDVVVTLPAVKGKPATELRLPVLFHSRRSYLLQLAFYHRYQGRKPPARQRGDETEEQVIALKRAHLEWSGSKIAQALGHVVKDRQVNRILKKAREAGEL